MHFTRDSMRETGGFGRRLAVLAGLCAALSACADRAAPTAAVPQYSLKVADAAMASGAPDMAFRVTEMILQREPMNVPALIASGDALYAMGQFTRARTAYSQALAHAPRSAAAYVGIGRTLVRSDPRAAEAAFAEALAIEPRNTAALNNLGITRDLMGRRAEAQETYRRALAIAPEMDEVTINLGMSLALSGQRDEAQRLLRPLAAQADAAPRWRKDIAAALTLAGDPVGARGALDGTAVPAARQPAPQAPWPVVAAAQPDAPSLPVAVQAAPRVAVQRAALDAPAAAPVILAARLPEAPPQPEPAPVPATPPQAQPAQAQPTPPAQTQPDRLAPRAEAPSAMAPQAEARAETPRPEPRLSARKRRALAQRQAPLAPEGGRATQPPGGHAGQGGGYQVQLASLDEEDRALDDWRRLLARLPQALRGHAPMVERAEINGRIFWRLRVGGFESKAAASAFCGRMRGTSQGCWVI